MRLAPSLEGLDDVHVRAASGAQATELSLVHLPRVRWVLSRRWPQRAAEVRIDDFKYRFTDQSGGWLGGTVKVDWPILTNIRLDPLERTGLRNGDKGSLAYDNWFAYEFWRFQFAQQQVAKLAQTAIEFPPMQKGASFNLETVKEQIQNAIPRRQVTMRCGRWHARCEHRPPRCYGAPHAVRG